jgi:hypothetical protein
MYTVSIVVSCPHLLFLSSNNSFFVFQALVKRTMKFYSFVFQKHLGNKTLKRIKGGDGGCTNGLVFDSFRIWLVVCNTVYYCTQTLCNR